MISKKQLEILAFPYTDYTGIIADGAIRSGKTSFLMISFIDWAMNNYNKQTFGVCGRTVGSTIKNVIEPYMALSYANEKYKVLFKRGENKLIVTCGDKTNTFYVFGGKDESSYMLIQGITLAGVLIDEVTLLVKSFVEQALARCSVEGSRFWFSCNPSSPEHWFYKEWIKKCDEKNLMYVHFELKDNPSLSDEMLNRYETMYTGVFYNRYIRGEWVQADGLVYSIFDKNTMTIMSESMLNIWGKRFTYADFYISIDYGITNPFAALLWCVIDDIAYCIDEYYYKADPLQNKPVRTDEEHYEAMMRQFKDYAVEYIIIDPSANSFKATIRKHGDVQVKNAKNDVLNGIAYTLTAFKTKHVYIGTNCTNLLTELGLYSWNSKSGMRDMVIKENDHACDSMRYFVYTVLRGIIDESVEDEVEL